MAASNPRATRRRNVQHMSVALPREAMLHLEDIAAERGTTGELLASEALTVIVEERAAGRLDFFRAVLDD